MSARDVQTEPPASKATTMALGDLVVGLASIEPGDADIRISRVTDDSRRVARGALFVAKRGPNHDGAAFIEDAIRRGASAILTESGAAEGGRRPDIAWLRPRHDVATVLARLAERFHGNPSSSMSVVGVTGTNGKTTTTTLVRHLLEFGGVRSGIVSTCAIDAGAGQPLAKAMQTTPGAVELSARLASMREHGCAAAVIETSSHALDQKRVAAIRYAVAVFTNLTGDHLDYHGTMDAYASAKAALFEMLDESGVAIVNADDPYAKRMVRDTRAGIVACVARSNGKQIDHREVEARLERRVLSVASVELIEYSARGMRIAIEGPFGASEIDLPLVGAHNAMNALQSACAASILDVSLESIEEGLASSPAPPGRLEPVTRIPGTREQFTVLVDYAHTDDALERSLVAVRPLVGPGGSVRVVFGCGGDRDRTKRPRMGLIASRFADDVIVTSDNPRTEDPSSIVEQVLAGVEDRERVEAIVDRERAIRRAIEVALDGDVVLIAGKGHEDYQILSDGRGGTVTRHFDDREVAREALNRRFGHPDTESKATPLANAAREHQA